MSVDAETPLAADEMARLTDFARAFKAAARSVVLYPAGHPAIAATLGRIAQITSKDNLAAPLKLSVLPESLLMDERPPARPDPAVTELATLLHGHLVGQLVVHPGGSIEAWRSLLLLLGRAPEDVRAEGGIARAWSSSNIAADGTEGVSRHVDILEIDYAEVLRERVGGESAAWDRVVASCLQGGSGGLDEDSTRELVSVAGDANRVRALLSAIEMRLEGSTDVKATTGQEGGIPGGVPIGARTAALLRALRRVGDAVSKSEPAQLDTTLQNLAAAVADLPAETIAALFKADAPAAGAGSPLMPEVAKRMPDEAVAHVVAREVIAGHTSIDRLAEAFQALVPEQDQRPRLLALAREEVAASPFGSTDGFESTWNQMAEEILTSYSDSSFVSERYAQELSGARSQAVEVERVSDDPPERVNAWLDSVATTALRALDLALLRDLLKIEQDDDRWGGLVTPVVGLVEDLLLVGDFDAAFDLIEVVNHEAREGHSVARRQHALIGVDFLVSGPMMRHLSTHLGTIDDGHFERVKSACLSIGVVLVRPVAEAISQEERPRSRERLSSILLAFGPAARRTLEGLRSSPNPAVRRAAIQLMREFASRDDLPELSKLLEDAEPQVQRDAVRAIVNIGTDEAFGVLERAISTGTPESRLAIMESIGHVRDDRVTPLFVYILRRVDHRGPLASVYMQAIESLGARRDPAAIMPLKEALYKGEWWAPMRTKALRSAAAAALARVGTPEAFTVLEEAAKTGPRAVRRIAQAQVRQRQARG